MHSILSALFLSACAGAGSDAASTGDGDVAGAYAALASELADCGQSFQACAADAAGDPDAIAACGEEVAACRESATDSAGMAGVDAAVADCAAGAQACFSEVRDEAAAAACRQELSACIGAGQPDTGGVPAAVDAAMPELPDAAARGGAAGGGPVDVSGCVDGLLSCIEGGSDPRACAGDARACVVAAVPAPDGAIPPLPPTSGNPGMAGGPAPAVDAGAPADLPNLPTPQPPVDAGIPDTPDVPVDGMGADCEARYADCIAAGGTPPQCGQQLRECGRP
jgi:hypothetical protein